MTQMIRKQIYIDAANEKFLKERSTELGVTEAEVVRQALAGAERQALEEAECRAKSASRQEALQNLLAYIREHRMSSTPGTEGSELGWTFNREELYDERLDRYGPRRDAGVESTRR